MRFVAPFRFGLRIGLFLVFFGSIASAQNEDKPRSADDERLIFPVAILPPTNATEAFQAAVEARGDLTLELKAIGEYEHAVNRTKNGSWLLVFAVTYKSPSDPTRRVQSRDKALREGARAARSSLVSLARPVFRKTAVLNSNENLVIGFCVFGANRDSSKTLKPNEMTDKQAGRPEKPRDRDAGEKEPIVIHGLALEGVEDYTSFGILVRVRVLLAFGVARAPERVEDNASFRAFRATRLSPNQIGEGFHEKDVNHELLLNPGISFQLGTSTATVRANLVDEGTLAFSTHFDEKVEIRRLVDELNSDWLNLPAGVPVGIDQGDPLQYVAVVFQTRCNKGEALVAEDTGFLMQMLSWFWSCNKQEALAAEASTDKTLKDDAVAFAERVLATRGGSLRKSFSLKQVKLAPGLRLLLLAHHPARGTSRAIIVSFGDDGRTAVVQDEALGVLERWSWACSEPIGNEGDLGLEVPQVFKARGGKIPIPALDSTSWHALKLDGRTIRVGLGLDPEFKVDFRFLAPE